MHQFPQYHYHAHHDTGAMTLIANGVPVTVNVGVLMTSESPVLCGYVSSYLMNPLKPIHVDFNAKVLTFVYEILTSKREEDMWRLIKSHETPLLSYACSVCKRLQLQKVEAFIDHELRVRAYQTHAVHHPQVVMYPVTYPQPYYVYHSQQQRPQDQSWSEQPATEASATCPSSSAPYEVESSSYSKSSKRPIKRNKSKKVKKRRSVSPSESSESETSTSSSSTSSTSSTSSSEDSSEVTQESSAISSSEPEKPVVSNNKEKKQEVPSDDVEPESETDSCNPTELFDSFTPSNLFEKLIPFMLYRDLFRHQQEQEQEQQEQQQAQEQAQVNDKKEDKTPTPTEEKQEQPTIQAHKPEVESTPLASPVDSQKEEHTPQLIVESVEK